MREFVLYIISGFVSLGVDLTAYYVLLTVGANPLLANTLSFLSGTLTGFVFNRYITFKVYDHVWRRAAIFFFIGVTNMLLNNIVLGVLIYSLGLSPLVAKLIAIPVGVGYSFSMSKYVCFR